MSPVRATDRSPRPCLHVRARHEHGTKVCYDRDRCRCEPCATSAATYERDRKRQHAYGRWANLVDAEPARQHLLALHEAGLSWKRASTLSGISVGTVWQLVHGRDEPGRTGVPSVRISPENARALLALTVADAADLADGAVTDSTGARRRIQALCATGWPVSVQARAAGVDRQALDVALRGRPIVARNARAIAAMYDRLWDQPPRPVTAHDRAGVTRALRAAQAGAWAPPMAWDDDQIDDPAARPARARASSVLDLDEWVHLVTGGEDHDRAAARLGVKLTAVERSAFRHGHTRVLGLLRRSEAAA